MNLSVENLGIWAGLVLFPTMLMAQDKRPNFVWMMAEDVSTDFVGLYNCGEGAQLPNLERMADEGIVFTHAYSNAPVSSAARSTLFTGCYAPRLGLSFHRCLQPVTLPEKMHMFPSYLRKAGYFTANAAKTDYNCRIDTTAWHVVSGKMGEWRNRPDKSKPFLFVRTNTKCHESCLHFTASQMATKKTLHDPKKVRLLPMHPDTELFRYTYATFYDRLRDVDQELGRMIEMLRADGELENTFIFFMGDNGGSLPGTKGYTGEVGLHVPLVVYVPERWRDQLPVSAGSRVDGLVSFVDLGPTLLHLAGIDIPQSMDGKPFLGKDILMKGMDERDVVYGYGDRFDELYAFNRTLRMGKYRYSRNFFPYHTKSLFAFYRYKQLAFNEWKTMYKNGQLNEVQRQFFEPQGAEELYDLEIDPHETVNLVEHPKYRSLLNTMRKRLFDHLLEVNDLGLLPECVWLDEASKDPETYGRKMHCRISSALKTANLQLVSYREGRKKAMKALNSVDEAVRLWALTACINWGKEAKSLIPSVRNMLHTERVPFVRARALVFMATTGNLSMPVDDFKKTLYASRNEAETLSILNDMAYMRELFPLWTWNVSSEKVPFHSESITWRLNYLNQK